MGGGESEDVLLTRTYQYVKKETERRRKSARKLNIIRRILENKIHIIDVSYVSTYYFIVMFVTAVCVLFLTNQKSCPLVKTFEKGFKFAILMAKNKYHPKGVGALKYGDVHEKFNLSKIKDLRPLSTC